MDGNSATSSRRTRSSTSSPPSWPLVPADPNYFGEVAGRWLSAEIGGEIGVISSVSQPFCRSCTRARLSAQGELFTCLFAARGFDLRAVMRGGASDDEIAAAIARVWTARTDRYSEIRSRGNAAHAEGRDVPHRRVACRGGSG